MLTIRTGDYYNHHLLLSVKAVTVSFISDRCFWGNSVLCPYIKLTYLTQIQPSVGSEAKPPDKARGVTCPWLGASTLLYLCVCVCVCVYIYIYIYIFIPLAKQFRPLAIFNSIVPLSCNLHVTLGLYTVLFLNMHHISNHFI